MCEKMMEIGLITPFKHGDILAYMICGFWCGYSFILEKSSCPPSMSGLVQNYTKMQYLEKRTCRGASNLRLRADIANKYNFKY